MQKRKALALMATAMVLASAAYASAAARKPCRQSAGCGEPPRKCAPPCNTAQIFVSQGIRVQRLPAGVFPCGGYLCRGMTLWRPILGPGTPPAGGGPIAHDVCHYVNLPGQPPATICYPE